MDILPFFSLGESNWLIVATGVADCYYNVADLPAGAPFRFRVACVNKAGQGPYSNLSEVVNLEASGTCQRNPVKLCIYLGCSSEICFETILFA